MEAVPRLILLWVFPFTCKSGYGICDLVDIIVGCISFIPVTQDVETVPG